MQIKSSMCFHSNSNSTVALSQKKTVALNSKPAYSVLVYTMKLLWTRTRNVLLYIKYPNMLNKHTVCRHVFLFFPKRTVSITAVVIYICIYIIWLYSIKSVDETWLLLAYWMLVILMRSYFISTLGGLIACQQTLHEGIMKMIYHTICK